MVLIKRGDTYGLNVVDKDSEQVACKKCSNTLYVAANEAQIYCSKCGDSTDNPGYKPVLEESIN